MPRTSVSIESGASLEAVNNTGQGGGGMYLHTNAHFLAKGVGTSVLVQGNTAVGPSWGTGAGLRMVDGSTWTLKEGAVAKIRDNIGASMADGGGIYLQGAAIVVDGQNTKLLVEGNRALKKGGWLYQTLGGATTASTTVTDGAQLHFASNQAGEYGGGACISDLGSSLRASGTNTLLSFDDNVAKLGGDVVAVMNSGTVTIDTGAKRAGSQVEEVTQLVLPWCYSKLPNGEHSLPGGETCMLYTHVHVRKDQSLRISTNSPSLMTSGPGIISGGHKTLLFYITDGVLTLEDLILEDGNSPYSGSILMDGDSANTFVTRTTIRRCEGCREALAH